MSEEQAVSQLVPRRKRMPTPAERNEWLRRYRESGLSVLQFCDEYKIPPQTLYQWLAKSRLAQSGSVVSVSSQPLAAFTEIKLEAASSASSWVAELQRPGGAILRVAAHVPAALLEQLLGAC